MEQHQMSTATDSRWSTKVTKGGGGGGKFETCPAGNHPATIIGIFLIGTHEKERDDRTRYETQDIVFLFELMEEKTDGTPFVMGMRCTDSMNDRATLYDLACSVLNQTFPENVDFDKRLLSGQPCQVQVIHKTGSKGDAVYANIASKGVKGFPSKMAKPIPTIPLILWTVDDGTPCPDEPWMPFIYGKSIKELADDSKEMKEHYRSKADENIAY